MAASVTGTFTLIDRASGPLKRIEAQARQTDRAISDVGSRLDEIGTQKQMRQHEELGRQLRQNEDNAELLNKRLGGTSRQTDMLAGSMGGAAVAGRRFGSVMTLLGVALVGLLPVIVDVAGGLGALVGSLGRALKGASALAVGGIGVLGVALGGLAGTILPTISNLGKLSQAFSAVTEAQQKYGKGSKEARDAMKEMAQARKGMENFDVSRGMAVVRGFSNMREDWSKMTAAGQSSILQMMLDTMNTTRSLMPMLARNANEIAAATGRAMRVFFERLDGPQFRRFIDVMTDVYETIARPLARSFANIGEALGNISVAASEELTRLALSLEDVTKGWVQSTSDIGRMRKMIGQTSRETGDWFRLLKASWNWLTALFGPGADEGQGLVQAMTDKLNEQTQWFRRNPATMAEFYRTSSEGVRRLARFLGDIAPTLMDISDAMRPVTQAFQQLVNLLSEIKIGDLSALTLAVSGLAIGRIGNTVRDLGGGRSLATGGLAAIMGAGSMRGWWAGQGAQPRGGGMMGSPAGGVGGMAPVPVWVTNFGGGMMPSPDGKGGGPVIFGGGRGGAPVGPSSPAKAPWWTKVPGLNRAGTAMTTVGARGAMLPGLAGGAARLGGGIARFAGRAFWPLALLMGIGDFLGTEGNVLQKLQGALSGATFGIIPKPRTDAEVSQAAMGNLTDQKGRLRLDPRTGLALPGTTRGDFAAERRRILSEADTKIVVRRGVFRSAPDLNDQQRREIRQTNLAEGKMRGDDIATGMSIRLRQGRGRKALEDATKSIFKDMNRAQSQRQAQSIAETSLAMAREAARGNPKLRGEYEKLAKGVEKRLDGMGKNVAVVNGRIYTQSESKWKRIKRAIVSEAEEARQEGSQEFTRLQQAAYGQLRAFGYTASEAKRMIVTADGTGQISRRTPEEQALKDNMTRGGKNNALGGRLPGYAAGGRLQGRGTKDTVPLTLGMAAPGELVVNRHTEGRVNSMLRPFGTNLGREVANERVPHSGTPQPGLRKKPKTDQYFRKGGRIAYPDAMGALPGLDALAYFLGKKFGLQVTSGARPGDMTSTGNVSDHSWGGAIDVSNGYATPQMDAAHAWLQSTFSGAIKQMLYRTMVGGNHFDHIHVALNEAYARNPSAVAKLAGGKGGPIMVPGGAGMTPAQRIKLRARRSRLRGIPGAMSQGAMDMVAMGLERSVNRKLGGGGGKVGPAGGGRLVGASVYGGASDPTSGTQGYRGDQLPGTMTYAELGYSGGDASSANLLGGLPYKAPLRISYNGKSVVARKRDIGAGGGDVQGRPRAIDLWHETASALGFPFGVGLVKVQRMAQGGRVPGFGGWYGDGGSFTADRPTLIGVGEKGKEKVTVTPTNRSSAGRGSRVQIGNIRIENHRKGDIKKQIKQELAQAFDELEREIGDDTGNGII